MTRRVLVGCSFTYRSQLDVPAVLQVAPRLDQPVTVLRSGWTFEPEQPVRTYEDLYGNSCLRTVVPVGRSQISFDALVEVPDEPEDADPDAREVAPGDLPDDVLLYTLPSRFVLPDVLGAEAWMRFGDHEPGYRRVQAICDHVNAHLTFRYGSSGPHTTAADVWASGYGVCRDFTHLAISFCRALNIPARYVFGYLPEIGIERDPSPMDFAAWMEVWLDGRWWTFDPRNNARRIGRVLIGRGRDASDVAMVTSFGGPVLESMTVIAQEATSDER